VPEPRDKSAIDNREDGSLRLHGGVCGLIQDASHLPVALRAAMTVVLARALLGAGACAHANIKTTDTYLNVTKTGLQESMRRFDESRPLAISQRRRAARR
jgi:hypothetical protein